MDEFQRETKPFHDREGIIKSSGGKIVFTGASIQQG
jgi:hypothetical protein